MVGGVLGGVAWSLWGHMVVSSMMGRTFSQEREWRCTNVIQEQEIGVKFIFILNMIGGVQGDFGEN